MINNEKNIKIKQLESLIFKSISELLYRLKKEINFSEETIITKIDLSKDLSIVKIYLFSIDGETNIKDFISKIIPYIPSLRFSLSSMVSFRRTPKIRFLFDNKYEKILKIEKLIDSIDKL